MLYPFTGLDEVSRRETTETNFETNIETSSPLFCLLSFAYLFLVNILNDEGIMAKVTRIKKEFYKDLMNQLVREKYEKSGKLARVLLEGFVFNEGIFSSEIFYDEKIIPNKTFKAFRRRLQADGFIDFTDASVGRKQYYPTKRIIDFVERAKKQTSVTIDYVDKSISKVNSRVDIMVDEMQDIKAQVNEIRHLLSELQGLQSPPPSVEAQKRSAVIAARLAKLMNSNSSN